MVKWDEKYREKGLVVLQLYSTCFDAADALRAHVAKVGMKYAVGHDPDGVTHRKYLKKAVFPVAYLVAADGKVAWEESPSSKADHVAEMEKAIEAELVKLRK